MGLRRQAISGAGWTAVATLVTVVAQLLQIAILARLLRPEDFGLMALVTVVFGLAHVYADGGLSSAIVHRQDATHEQLSSLFWLNVGAGVVMAVVLVAAAPLVAFVYAEPELTSLIALAALAFLVTPVGQQLHMRLQKALRFGFLAVTDVLSATAGVTVSVTLALHGYGVLSLVWGFLAGALVRTAALVWFGMRDWQPQLRFRFSDLRGFLRFGAFQMGERTVNYLSANLDKLLIGSLLGAHALGLYSVAFQLVMKPMRVVNPIFNRVAFPLFAKVQTDKPRLRAGFLDGIRTISFVLFPVYAGIIVLGEPLILLVLGETWRAAVPLLQVLAVLGFFYSLGNPLGSLLLATGRVEIGFYLNIWRLLLFAAAIFVGVRWDILGVAVALVAATALGMFPLGFVVRWILVEMRPTEYIRAFAPMLITALVMAAAVLLARDLELGVAAGAIGELVVLIAIGGALYLAIAITWQRRFFAKLMDTLR